MRTTVNIDDEVLAAAKVLAARTHRTIGSVLEEALRRMLFDAEQPDQAATALPDFSYAGGLRAGVDLQDKDTMAELLGESGR
jgi:plasmid stability protein